MAHWNHRVLWIPDESGGGVYRVHEVYYDDDGRIEGWTAGPVEPLGESLSELREEIRYFLTALRSPVLEEVEEEGRCVLRPVEDSPAINEGHFLEVMDRASVALDYCYQFVGSHPVIRRSETLRTLYDQAEDVLSRLYQEAAKLAFAEASERPGVSRDELEE